MFKLQNPLNSYLIIYSEQMAAVAALCVQYEAQFRPDMSIVVKALQPLLNTLRGPSREAPHLSITHLR